jgi:hypothetical protein
MKPEAVTFLWVEIEGFRGFRDRQRIELAASVVIMAGPNGTGKTSVFDALQWLLLGSLERLEPLRARRNTEHIANAFRGDAPAVVTARLKIREAEVEVERRGRYEGGILEWRDNNGVLRGQDAERRLAAALLPDGDDPASLRRLVMTSALLQQDVVREVLEDKPGDRYQHLASLLGVNDVNAFEVAARRRADRFAEAGRVARAHATRIEQQHRGARERVESLRAQQAAASDTARARQELSQRLLPHRNVLRLSFELPAAVADALLLQTNVRDIGDELARVQSGAEELQERTAVSRAVDASEIQAATDAVQKAVVATTNARRLHQEAEDAFTAASTRAEGLASLATVALPLLGERCPVCAQTIVQHDVEQHLRELIERGGADLPELDVKRQQARQATARAEAEEREAKERLESLRRQQAIESQLVAGRDQLLAQIRTVTGRAKELGIDLLLGKELESVDAEALAETIESLRTLWRVAGDLATVLRALPAGDEIAAADGELLRLQTALKEARARASDASAREEQAKTLQRAATRAATGVAQARFRELAPLIADIYSRLDPHPVFKALDFALGVYRERGEARPVVRDVDETVEAEPLIVFSSSQANVAALSVFLALGWAAGIDAMPFVLLDDPLQSLDDVNALGFADLCRHVRQQRQLIVSTHDRRLAALLERKLAPRTTGEETRVVEFTSWTKRGPQLEPRTIEPQLREGAERRLVAAAA